MIGLAYGPAPTIPGVYVLTLVILVKSIFREFEAFKSPPIETML